MVSDRGGLATARYLLHASSVSEGFTALWERRRLDLTVEAVVLQERFAPLFSDEERRIARARLREYGYHAGGRPQPRGPCRVGRSFCRSFLLP